MSLTLSVTNKPLMLSVVLLNVVSLSVVMQNVVAPYLWLLCGDTIPRHSVSNEALSVFYPSRTE
jgi:hypothetical protein